jgi:hypothetical protein
VADPDECRKASLLARGGHELLERFPHDVGRRTALTASDPLELSQKSGVEQD